MINSYCAHYNGNPQFSSVNAIMHAMGYRLNSQKL
jgi:DNA-binding phage protein